MINLFRKLRKFISARDIKWNVPLVLVGVMIVFVISLGFAVLVKKNTDNTNPTSNSLLRELNIREANSGLVQPLANNEVRRVLGFDDSRKLLSYFERSTALYVLLAEADLKTLQEYLSMSNQLGKDDWREEVQKKIVQRIATLDASVALNVVKSFPTKHRGSFVSMVFLEWSLSNIEEAIQHAGDLSAELKKFAVESILLTRDDLSDSERRFIARQLGLEWIALKLLSNHRPITEVIENPEQEWKAFLRDHRNQSLEFNDLQSKMFVYIARAWILREGIIAVDFIEDSFPQHWSFVDALSAVIDDLVKTDPEIALNISVRVQKLRTHQHFELAKQVMDYWVELDPMAALNSTFALKNRSLRRNLQRHVLEFWADRDPHNLLMGVDRLPENFRDLARKYVSLGFAKQFPQKALESMAEISDRDLRDLVVKKVVERWAKHDISSVLAWIENEQEVAHLHDELREKAFKSLADEHPHLAFQTALKQPIEGEYGMEANVIDHLAIVDLDTAVLMLPDARAGATRHRGYDSVILLSLLTDDFERALEIFIQKAEEEVLDERNLTLYSFVREAPNLLYASIEKIPAVDLQVQVAQSLLRNYQNTALFTDEQIVHLQEITRQPREDVSTSKARLQDAIERLDRLIEADLESSD